MANTRSAKKANRSSLRKRQFNLVTKNKIKAAYKGLRKAISNKSADLSTTLSNVFSVLDKAAKTRFIPKQRVDRKKSRLAKMVAKSSENTDK